MRALPVLDVLKLKFSWYTRRLNWKRNVKRPSICALSITGGRIKEGRNKEVRCELMWAGLCRDRIFYIFTSYIHLKKKGLFRTFLKWLHRHTLLILLLLNVLLSFQIFIFLFFSPHYHNVPSFALGMLLYMLHSNSCLGWLFDHFRMRSKISQMFSQFTVLQWYTLPVTLFRAMFHQNDVSVFHVNHF